MSINCPIFAGVRQSEWAAKEVLRLISYKKNNEPPFIFL